MPRHPSNRWGNGRRPRDPLMGPVEHFADQLARLTQLEWSEPTQEGAALVTHAKGACVEVRAYADEAEVQYFLTVDGETTTHHTLEAVAAHIESA